MTGEQEAALNLVRQPARYIGGEINSCCPEWAPARLRFCLCFPDLYETGMSNLGLRILYRVINEIPGCLADRAFAPAPDREAQLRERGWPLAGLETGRALSDFDVIAVTLASELNSTNLLTVLERGGIPPAAADRGESDPLVIAGGNGAFSPEPLADFCDAFFVGDGEAGAPALAGTLLAQRSASRVEKLAALADLPGFYVPSLYRPSYDDRGGFAGLEPLGERTRPVIGKVAVSRLDEAPFPTAWLVPWLPAVHDRVSIEIMRGCVHRCHFCQARTIYGPCRTRSPETVLALAREAFDRTGYEEIGLLSLSSGDYPRLEELRQLLGPFCRENSISVTFPSLRADTLDLEAAGPEAERKRNSLTLAPESSERLRHLLGKEIDDRRLLEIAREARQNGWRRLKLYFMLGLPGETPADLAEVARLLGELGSLIRVNAAFNTFIPKPHTPLEREAMTGRGEYLEKTAFLRRELKGNRFVSARFQPWFGSYLEALACRGDRRVGQVILEAWRGGARLDGWGEHFRAEPWLKALERADFDPDAQALAARDPDAPLPWDHIRC